MNKLLFVVGLLSILLISGCTSVEEFKSLKELIGPIQLEGSGSSSSCSKVISEEVDILDIKTPSKISITLATSKTFNDIEDAKEYVDIWHSATLKTGDGAKADLAEDISGKIFVGVVKVDKGNEAFTHPIVCVNGKIMENSEKTLKKIG